MNTPQPKIFLTAVTHAPIKVLLVEDNVVVRDMFRYGIQKLTARRKFPGTRLTVELPARPE